MDFEATHEKIEATSAEEYKAMIDEWAVAFARRHLPEDFDFGDPPKLVAIFTELSKQGIIPHCVQEELIVGVPKTVTYSFTTGDIIMAELKIKLEYESWY